MFTWDTFLGQFTTQIAGQWEPSKMNLGVIYSVVLRTSRSLERKASVREV